MNFIELAKLMRFDYARENLKYPKKIAMTNETFLKMVSEFTFNDSISGDYSIHAIFGMEIEIRDDIDSKVLFIIE